VCVVISAFIHEIGHFLCAKLTRFPVEVFSFGFGPQLVDFRLGETDIRFSLIPLGGYVTVVHEDFAKDPRGEAWWDFLKRVLFYGAGVASNIALAGFLYASHAYLLIPKDPAPLARLPGTVLIASEIGTGLRGVPQPARISHLRALEGCASFTALHRGVKETFRMVCLTGKELVKISSFRTIFKNVEGPIAIAGVAKRQAGLGLRYLMLFAAALSINSAIINLLPLPGMDGGHIAILGFERMAGRRLRDRTRNRIFTAGMVSLMLVMGVLVCFDLKNSHQMQLHKN